MGNCDTPFQTFKGLFGERGGDNTLRNTPRNVEEGHSIVPLCGQLLATRSPGLRSYLDRWDQRKQHVGTPDGPREIDLNLHLEEQRLVKIGMWEAAWALAQLHYAQWLGQEAASGRREFGKGHPLCNLALVGQAVRSPTLERHYGLLSSAGDVYKAAPGTPGAHGFGSTIAQRYESYKKHYQWRDEVGTWLAGFGAGEPIYLEAALARRWFAPETAARLDGLANVCSGEARPFVEVLLRTAARSRVAKAIRGTCFEAAAGLLLSATPGFEVHEARETSDEQVDLVVRYEPEHLAPVGLDPGPGLVECKSSTAPVTSKELRNFAAKCMLHRTKFGILFARADVTGRGRFDEPNAAELVRRRFQIDGLLVLVVTAKDMEGRWYEMRGLAEPLAEDLRELVFGPKG